jgi:penicillin amidase
MTIYNRILAVIISLSVIGIALIIFAFNITTISQDKKNTNINSSEINADIRIYSNQYGLKKIVASDNYDLFFAQGFIHARDRLWQMDMTRRRAAGKMSEIFGKRTLEADVFFRAFELDEISKKSYDSLDAKYKFILEAYSAGVNHFIKNNSNLFSFEFSALDYFPEEWEPYHTILISKLFAFQMSFSFWNDVTLGEIASLYSPEIAMDLIPDINNYEIKKAQEPIQKSDSLQSKDSIQLLSLFRNFNMLLENTTKSYEISAGTRGSNSWSVYKNKISSKEGAILANDPHLPLGLPSVWYQNHIISDSINVLGYSIPGVPLVLVGRNESVSWGITNMMADICDFYFEKTDSTKDYYHINENETKQFEYKTDTIYIKNDKPHIYYKKKNDKSVVISDSHLFKKSEMLIDYNSDSDLSFFNDYCLTFNWTGLESTNEIEALYKINTAENKVDFKRGTDLWGSPPLIFNYADTNGNIALFHSGLIPKRKSECNPNLPNPGWNENAGWNGYFSGKDFKTFINSDSGYVYSANVPVQNYDFFISNYWEPMSRAVRIKEMINESEYYSIRDARFMQNDILSPYAKRMLHIIIPILENNIDNFDTKEIDCIEALKNWDFLMSATSEESAIFNSFLTHLIKNTYYDELGERLLKQFTFLSGLPTRKILNDLINNNKFWFDNKNTDEIEDCDIIVIKSFSESIKFLRGFYGTDDISDWKYGDLHTLELRHILSENEFLEPIVTSKLYQIGGNNTTINNTEYHFFNPYKVVVGASMRFIADMETDYVLMSMPGGNSGDPISPQYADQIRLWLNGGYIQVEFYDNTEYSEYMSFIKD